METKEILYVQTDLKLKPRMPSDAHMTTDKVTDLSQDEFSSVER